MLKIGEFAKKCGVNVQTLRYYDQIGVLCPDRVDDATGYRYYHPDKIKTFQLIEQLKQNPVTIPMPPEEDHTDEGSVRYIRFQKPEFRSTANTGAHMQLPSL